MTEDICSICYVNTDLVSANEIRSQRDLGGKTPLIMCRVCLDNGIYQPCSSARKNVKQAKQQKQAANKRRLEAAVESGRRKAPST